MRYAWFPGCKIAHHQPQYGKDARQLCKRLGVTLEDIEFDCCGWPIRQESLVASAVSAARNLARAERAGLPILTPCKCCYGNLSVMLLKLRQHDELRETVRPHLASEGLDLPEEPKIVHILTLMDERLDALREMACGTVDGQTVAASYGCHALRPSEATAFDDPLAPTVFERVLEALGAQPVPWQMRLECCGHFLRDRNDAMAEALGLTKLRNAAGAGAGTLVTACTYCQTQFEAYHDAPELPRAETVAAFALRALGDRE